jgi:hypothetical protein
VADVRERQAGLGRWERRAGPSDPETESSG